MITFAFETSPPRGPLVIVMILEAENRVRMNQADPFDIKLADLPSNIIGRRLRDVDLVIAFEDDTEMIAGFQNRNDIKGLMAWIERGRRIIPGDRVPPQPLRGDKAQ
jgi:hypothetical protein